MKTGWSRHFFGRNSKSDPNLNMTLANIKAVCKPMAVEYSNLSRPDGSALYSLGDTVVQAGVYGPTEVRINKELINKSYVEAVFRSKIGSTGCIDRVKENLIKNTVESVIYSILYPRTAIMIVVQELQDSGSLLATSINAAFLAVLDSGLAMKNTVASVGCCISHDKNIIVHPSQAEEQQGRASMTFVFESVDSKVVSIITGGSFSEQEYQNCLDTCLIASKEIFTFYRSSVERRFVKENYEPE